MGTPSVSATSQARYERTTIPVATANSVVNTTQQNIGKNVTVGAGVSLGLGTPGKKMETVDTAYLYPQNSTDTYIQAGEDSFNQLTVVSDKTAAWSLYTANVQTSGFTVGDVNIKSVSYSATEAFLSPYPVGEDRRPSLTEESASFSLTRGGESCKVAVSVTTEDPNPAPTGSVSENCSFLDGAQALTLAQQIAQQIK